MPRTIPCPCGAVRSRPPDEGAWDVFVVVFLVLGMVLVWLARFAQHVMRTRGGWYGLAATLPFLGAIGFMVYLATQGL